MNPRRNSPTSGRNQQRANDQIRSREVRVISETGEQLGVLNIRKALELATEAGLDLVEVAPNEDIPVCRIMDFGKFRYQMAKKQNPSAAKAVKTKEIRLRPGTGDNDVAIKIKNARGFLTGKNRVLVSIVFKGRELAHIQEGERIMQHVLEELADIGKPDSAPSKQGKRITCVISPL